MRTLTFIADKPGLHTLGGRDYAGEVQVDGLGVAAEQHADAAACLNEPSLFAEQLHPRRHDSHKGKYGDVIVIGGASGMAGAPVLAARCALFAGAGRVIVAALAGGGQLPPFDSVHPEIMFRPIDGLPMHKAAVVIGPGLGDSAQAMAILGEALAGDTALVLDADGLNLVSASVDLGERLRDRAARGLDTVITPHPLEAARLLAESTAQVQADRLQQARALAERYQAVVVLKGSGTVIAAPGKAVIVNGNGNPGLATGGSGDVLAGLCGALLAQGWPAREAAAGAVWMHGAAADLLVGQGAGPIGMTAGELPAAVRAVFNALVAQNQEDTSKALALAQAALQS